MGTTENITVVKGAYGYRLAFTLKDDTGKARNMFGYSIKLQVWSSLVPETLLLDKAMNWIDETVGTCYYDVQSKDFDIVGVYAYAIKAYISTTVIDIALSGFIIVTQYGGSYCTLEEVKSELGIDGNLQDDIIQRIIPQVKTAIDNYCSRQFDTTSATRYFDGSESPLFIDDLASLTGEGAGIFLDEDADGTYEDTMATTDYILKPSNTTPKTYIEVTPYGDYADFAYGVSNGVKIVGTWGYSSTVPEPIRRAAIIWTCRLFKRKDSAYQDVVSTPELGTISIYKGLDPEIKLILNPYRRFWG